MVCSLKKIQVMEEIEQQPRTNKETRRTKQTLGKSKSSSILRESLPWWVELLFVQVGLPEDWLRNYLKNKKVYKARIKKHNKKIFVYVFTAAGIIYLYPFYNLAQTENLCIQQAIEHIQDNSKSFSKSKRNRLVVYASNLCNGGSMFNSIK